MIRPMHDAGDFLCLNCRRQCSGGARQCDHCGYEVSWLDDAPRFKNCLALMTNGRRERKFDASCAVERCGRRVSIRKAHAERCFGRSPDVTNEETFLPHPRVAPLHAVAACLGGRECWLVDAGSDEGTFVNRERIVARRLASGDLVQIGPYGWVFNETQGLLVPAAGIEGLAIECVDVKVAPKRLGPLNLTIAPGELVAVVGKSGSGKSTLAKVLCGQRGLLASGKLLADGLNAQAHRDWFRRRLGYVSQDEAMHRDLTPREAVAFTCLLRGGDPASAENLLSEVDLPQDCWERPISSLSGGEAKRVRIASELANLPGLLVLDEAASGLDWQREKSLTRLLRTLSHRGCTVVNVTHNLRQLDAFGRMIVVRQGHIVFDGSPAELRRQTPSGDLADLDLNTIADADGVPGETGENVRHNPSPPDLLQSRRHGGVSSVPRALQQASVLLSREWTLLGHAGCIAKRLVVPLVVLPFFFAAALACAVKPDDTALLGFLSLLSCIWMGASLTLMAIADEREVFNHERLLFLGIGPYVATKTLVGWFAAFVQTSIFFAMLTLLRLAARGGGTSPSGPLVFHRWPWALASLVVVSIAGTGVGLLLSAIAGRHRPIANFLLPLVMIAQIVFSVQIAAPDSAKEALEKCYGEFHPHQCASGLHAHGRRAEWWLPKETRETTKSGKTAATGWVCSDCKDAQRPDAHRDSHDDVMRPNLLASLASYLTISRYGDIVLRSFAYFPARAGDSRRFSYCRWRWEATITLAAIAVGLPLTAAVVLLAQERSRPQLIRVSRLFRLLVRYPR